MMFLTKILWLLRNASREVSFRWFLMILVCLSGIECPVSAQTLKRDFQFHLPLFSLNSAWNQTVKAAEVLPESNRQILITYRVLRGDTTSLYPRGQLPPTTWPFADISYDEYSIPIFRMGFRNQSVMLCDYNGNIGWPGPKFPKGQLKGGPVIVPAPNSVVRPSGPQSPAADGHLVLYDPQTFMEYDYWQATTVRNAQCKSLGGGLTGTAILEAGVIDFFDVRKSGANPNTYYSARATGTPLLGGLILPEDIENGIIAHGLAFAIPGLRNTCKNPSMPLTSDYFYPTSTTETDFFNTDPYALAAGQRIRLKQRIVDDEGNLIDEGGLAIITKKFLKALRTYGAILVDNASGFSFYAEDFHSAVLHLPDSQIRFLIGQSSGVPLPEDKTKWQIVLDKLNEELEQIPFAYGPWEDGQNPASAKITISNFEVVESAKIEK